MKWHEVAQSCLTLCDLMDCSSPGSSVHGILQARILEWVAISFSRGSSQPRDWTQVSCIAGRCFNLWATREALIFWGRLIKWFTTGSVTLQGNPNQGDLTLKDNVSLPTYFAWELSTSYRVPEVWRAPPTTHCSHSAVSPARQTWSVSGNSPCTWGFK